MPCKGICIRHKASRGYADGHKRCQQCNIFIKWEGLLCPCCGYKLRTGPRRFKYKVKYKEKLREQKRIKEHKIVAILCDL
jgi:predicted amidophosphoribosyltransferase